MGEDFCIFHSSPPSFPSSPLLQFAPSTASFYPKIFLLLSSSSSVQFFQSIQSELLCWLTSFLVFHTPPPLTSIPSTTTTERKGVKTADKKNSFTCIANRLDIYSEIGSIQAPHCVWGGEDVERRPKALHVHYVPKMDSETVMVPLAAGTLLVRSFNRLNRCRLLANCKNSIRNSPPTTAEFLRRRRWWWGVGKSSIWEPSITVLTHTLPNQLLAIHWTAIDDDEDGNSCSAIRDWKISFACKFLGINANFRC